MVRDVLSVQRGGAGFRGFFTACASPLLGRFGSLCSELSPSFRPGPPFYSVRKRLSFSSSEGSTLKSIPPRPVKMTGQAVALSSRAPFTLPHSAHKKPPSVLRYSRTVKTVSRSAGKRSTFALFVLRHFWQVIDIVKASPFPGVSSCPGFGVCPRSPAPLAVPVPLVLGLSLSDTDKVYYLLRYRTPLFTLSGGKASENNGGQRKLSLPVRREKRPV